MIDIAFANDCDLMTWNDYLYVHSTLERLSLPVGDSFWLFSPDNEAMGLFLDDTLAKTDNHDNLLGQIKEGRIDVLHGIGAFGRTQNYPTRDGIRRAFDYLDKQGCDVRIWSNHGSAVHVHNMAAQAKRSYQQGDLPYSPHYVQDIAREYGIEFYWFSHNLRHTLDEPYRTVLTETLPSGDTVRTFTRFAPSWKTNAWTIAEMITRESLEKAVAAGQNVIYFTHWGTRGKGEDMTKPLLRRESLMALATLAEMQAEGRVRVVRLLDLLRRESGRTLEQEVQRIGDALLKTRHTDVDSYYKVQFEDDKTAYFSDLMDGLGLKGKTMLDAGGGTGNLCFPAASRFESLVCLDASEQALRAGMDVAKGLQIPSIHFEQGKLEQFHIGHNVFDLICARGVIHLVDLGVVLKNFHEMARPGATVLITVNGDGFYQHAIEEKRMNVQGYGQLLWNTFYHRAGGDGGLLRLLDEPAVREALQGATDEALFDRLLQSGAVARADVMGAYLPPLKARVGGHAADYLLRLAAGRGDSLEPGQARRAQNAVTPKNGTWRCHYPEEFEQEARAAGFKIFMWRTQSGLLPKAVSNKEEDAHGGLLKMWYALLVK